MRPIFEAHSLDEQRKLFEKHWKPRVFATFLKVAASEYVFNKFLYKGHFSGSTDARTEARSPSTFIEEEFTRIFKTTLVRKNYFMQILFLGGIYYEEGLPIEAQPMCLEKVRSSKTEVSFLTENLIEVLKRETYDFISLSDTISYLPHDLASSILQILPPNTKTGTQMIIRSFLRKPPGLNTEGWREEVELNEWAKKLDTTAVYDFDIFSKL
jgi:S-adenosylmethionine-diacylglycerol 3-amino-3-carboxypropyl transferase